VRGDTASHHSDDVSFDVRVRGVIHHGDCVEVMATLEPDSIDAIVTDPPAGIGFMGKSWDHHRGGRDLWVAWMTEVMTECLRVAKPGAYAVVWALPRTSHWTGWALENAGWELRDKIIHGFATGFPKSHNLPGGLGTALKPAYEDWWLARKPLVGTVAANRERYGTGALNIDGTRIPMSVADADAINAKHAGMDTANYQRPLGRKRTPSGAGPPTSSSPTRSSMAAWRASSAEGSSDRPSRTSALSRPTAA
jgi:hypothetical protein